MKNNNTATPQLEQTTRWARLKATNFWQAAFIRPFPSEESRWKTRLASTLSYAFGPLLILLMSASLIDGYMTSVIPLESMHKTTGVLESVHLCFKCTPVFEIRDSSGEVIEFYSSPNQLNEIKPYIGTEIRIWSQEGFRIPTSLNKISFYSERIDEIQVGVNGKYINQYKKQYNEKRDELIRLKDSRRRWEFGFLLLGIWLPFRVWWKHRRVF